MSLDRVNLVGAETTAYGITLGGNSMGIVSDLNIDGGVGSIEVTQGSFLNFSGETNVSGLLKATQGNLKLSSSSIVTSHRIALESMSSIQANTGSILTSNGRFSINTNSSVRARTLIVNDDELRVERGSVLRVTGDTAHLSLTNGRLRIEQGSTVVLSEGFVDSSLALQMSANSTLVIDPEFEDTPFLFIGESRISNSSITAEDVAFEGSVELEHSSTMILDSFESLIFGADQQEGSNIYID